MNKLSVLLMVLALITCGQAGLLTWTGGGDGASLFQEANWDLDGTGAPAGGTIDGNVTVWHDILVNDPVAAVGGMGAGSDLYIGYGHKLTITAGQMLFAIGKGIKGIDGGATTYIDLLDGKLVAQFVAYDVAATLGGNAVLELLGADNPINGITINFTSPTCQIHCVNETVAAFVAEHLGKITVNGQPAVAGADPSMIEARDNLLVISDGASGSIVTMAMVDPVAVNPMPGIEAEHVYPVGTMAWDVINSTNPTFDINIGTDSTCDDILAGYSTGSASNYSLDPGLLDYGTEYFWRVDVTNEGTEYTGQVWRFTTGGKATDPVPADGHVADRSQWGMSWSGDVLVSSYDVWFGLPGSLQFVDHYSEMFVSFSDLAAAMGQVILEAGNYQWRVDTRDSDGLLMSTGDVWTVHIPEAMPIVIDDFEAYDDTSELAANWAADAGAILQYDNVRNMMRFDYDDVSEVTMNLSPVQNWLSTGMDTFVISILGNEMNDPAEILLTVRDDSTSATIAYSQSDTTTSPWWRQCHVRLSEFEDAGVDLTNVTMIKISITNGSGSLCVDDLLLEKVNCIAEFQPRGDLNKDCSITLADIEILADHWLLKAFAVNPTVPNSDLLLAHYEFDEVTGALASDSSGNNYHAAVNADDTTVIWNPSGYNGGCIELDNSVEVTIPSVVLNSVTEAVTIAMWVNGETTDYPDGANRVAFAAGSVLSGEHSWDRTEWAIDNADSYGGQWNHYAAVKDTAAGLMNLYHNGVLVGQATGANETMEGMLSDDIVLSMAGFYSWKVSTIRIDDLRIYGYALSQDEIADLAGGTVVQPVEPIYTEADLGDDSSVNLPDFAIISQQWLEQK